MLARLRRLADSGQGLVIRRASPCVSGGLFAVALFMLALAAPARAGTIRVTTTFDRARPLPERRSTVRHVGGDTIGTAGADVNPAAAVDDNLGLGRRGRAVRRHRQRRALRRSRRGRPRRRRWHRHLQRRHRGGSRAPLRDDHVDPIARAGQGIRTPTQARRGRTTGRSMSAGGQDRRGERDPVVLRPGRPERSRGPWRTSSARSASMPAACASTCLAS